MYCVIKASQPPSWRGAESCDVCNADEYCADDAPGNDWIWDAVAEIHRLPTASEIFAVTNKATWAAQAAARKGREAQAALAEPDSSDPEILRRKLNAALHLLNSR